MFDFLGDVLSSEAGNSIPILAIIYALLSSMNSVGVSVYQEHLFKVQIMEACTIKNLDLTFNQIRVTCTIRHLTKSRQDEVF